jgi:hypothetical protein
LPITTTDPALAIAKAVALPMPVPPPVTMPTLSFKFAVVVFLRREGQLKCERLPSRWPRFTAVASTIIKTVPATALLPRWTRCQSLAKPSCAQYSHIGDIAIRLRKVTPRIVNELNRSISRTSRS